MTTTSLADAKNRLSEIVASAVSTHERTVITKNGTPSAVLMSVQDLETLEATLEVLGDPQALASLRESEITQDFDYHTTGDEMTLIMERRFGGDPMSEAEQDALIEARMGREAYLAARAGIYARMSRDPDANVRERARDYLDDPSSSRSRSSER